MDHTSVQQRANYTDLCCQFSFHFWLQQSKGYHASYIQRERESECKNKGKELDFTFVKSETANILVTKVREHLNNNYQNHIKNVTDGIVWDSLDSRAGFVIPDLKVQKSFYVGKGLSIYSHLSYMQY